MCTSFLILASMTRAHGILLKNGPGRTRTTVTEKLRRITFTLRYAIVTEFSSYSYTRGGATVIRRAVHTGINNCNASSATRSLQRCPDARGCRSTTLFNRRSVTIIFVPRVQAKWDQPFHRIVTLTMQTLLLIKTLGNTIAN